MSSEEKISAIVTSFNQSETIESSLQSIVDQDLEEIIVIDDSSIDKSQKIISKMARKHKKIKPIFNTENLGVSTSLNIAIAASESRYVMIQGGDDKSSSDRVVAHKEQLNNYPEVAVHLSRPKFDFIQTPSPSDYKNNSEFNLFKSGIILPSTLFIHENKLCAPTALIDKNHFINKNIFKENLIQLQDFWLWIDLSWQKKILLHDNQIIQYGIGRKSTLSGLVKDTDTINYTRNQIERNWIYRNFFTKRRQSDLMEFFPMTEVMEKKHVLGSHWVQVLLIQFYFSHPRREVREVGLNMLYDILDNVKSPKIIMDSLHMHYSDIRDLTFL